MQKPIAVAYCRVSTKSNAQMHSLGYQTDYWKGVIAESDEYEFGKIYADAGIGGRSMHKRPQLLRMLQDAKEKKFNVIFTKSVARFARNTEELLTMVRELRELGVKVVFEKEQIDTFNPNSEVYLTIAASVAENDLKIYSENQTWSIRQKYKEGYISVGAGILGYTMNKETNTLEIEPVGAELVKRIFKMYIDGMGMIAISKQLQKEGIKFGNRETWSRGTLGYILTNEKYIGNALSQKYYTVDGVSRLNHGVVKQYYMENTHEPIISLEDFQLVQKLMRERAGEWEHTRKPQEYEFSGKIRCGVCGGGYMRKVQNKNLPYRVDVWVCCKKDMFGEGVCNSTRIKDAVLKAKFVECYNEFITAGGDDDAGAMQKEQLAELLAQERELYALKVNRMIEIADYNIEWKKLKEQIDELNRLIEMRELHGVSKSDYVPITEFDADKVEKFIDHVEIVPHQVTFVFINGARISREYTNGKSGNSPGWAERRKERLAKEQEVTDGDKR